MISAFSTVNSRRLTAATLAPGCFAVVAGVVLVALFKCQNFYAGHFAASGSGVVLYNLLRAACVPLFLFSSVCAGAWSANGVAAARANLLRSLFSGAAVLHLGIFLLGTIGCLRVSWLGLSAAGLLLWQGGKAWKLISLAVEESFQTHSKASAWFGVGCVTASALLLLAMKGLYPAGGA